jgi:hypothetical protein
MESEIRLHVRNPGIKSLGTVHSNGTLSSNLKRGQAFSSPTSVVLLPGGAQHGLTINAIYTSATCKCEGDAWSLMT